MSSAGRAMRGGGEEAYPRKYRAGEPAAAAYGVRAQMNASGARIAVS